MKIALFLPNWIGDAVMATPSLRAIRDGYPHANITAVLRPYVADVLAGTDLVDDIVDWSPKGKNKEQRTSSVIGRLKAERFDLGVLFPNSLRSAWVAWRSGIRRRVGFGRDGRGILLTDSLQPFSRSTPNPVIDEYARLARAVGCTPSSLATELAVLPEDERRLDNFWSSQSIGRNRGLVCLNPGGAFGAAKHWPIDSFAELATKLVDQYQKTVLILCGPSEREQARDIVQKSDRSSVLSLADAELSIGLTKAAVRSAELLITTDSGPRHFAQPFGVPAVTLFGPTHIAWSETYDEHSTHLQLQLDCGPCQQRVCPLKEAAAHHRCMRDLSAEQVLAAAGQYLNKSSSIAA
ncbi:lipopolysaccharide heptosyltransferase II [Calycomorphotria hydatis]|uniref:lipopolysaccharide heptosyltransferase II n=1 Tax=Calycomorphotria hydatis TaxID=2528027 RepID=A0A517TEN5_9PLAN|nr:lipopolysaccharide heptosyltransferase II [Calycomorphotria hydatis]QDT66833.1 ADP-heptose--LPS heptosyltransferase 2 [Calycomorphotria hydatis]